MAHLQRKHDDLVRHALGLRALQDANEVLFYRLLLDHIEEMTLHCLHPGGCAGMRTVQLRPTSTASGLFLSPIRQRDSIAALLRNRPNREVDVIVVTDGELILGIGDQGVEASAFPSASLPCIP